MYINHIICIIIDIKYIENVPIALKANDIIGGFALPDLEGKIDLSTIIMGETPMFLQWVNHIFDYYWDRAESGK